ncbi:MAG: hypothetical protein Q8P05_00295 [Candidatus Diapherotrites archaeon]|nr:hypothetical protein [Candidatus Diapherotrites archaeon]
MGLFLFAFIASVSAAPIRMEITASNPLPNLEVLITVMPFILYSVLLAGGFVVSQRNRNQIEK